MKDLKFYVCAHCGNLVEKIYESGVPMICCGEAMKQIKPNTVDASMEKHIPIYNVNSNEITVTIGSVIHPMSEEHHINWVYLLTDKGVYRHNFEIGASPVTTFIINNEKPLAIYAYCNLHGLWLTEIK